jgi:hypothetical protein
MASGGRKSSEKTLTITETLAPISPARESTQTSQDGSASDKKFRHPVLRQRAQVYGNYPR